MYWIERLFVWDGKGAAAEEANKLGQFCPKAVTSLPTSPPTGPHSLSIYPALIRRVAPRGIIGSFHHGRNGSECRRESCSEGQRGIQYRSSLSVRHTEAGWK